VSDFIFADAAYFQTGSLFSDDTALPQEAIDAVTAQGGITAGGRIYGKTGMVYEGITEKHYRELYSSWNSEETLDQMVAAAQRTKDGLLSEDTQLYGMEDYPLDKLTVLEGALDGLHTPGSKSIAAVYQTDDYGNVIESSNWAKLGDTVKLEYVDEFDYVSPETGEPVNPASGESYISKVVKSHTVEYTVTALVSVPFSLSYRYYGSDEFVLNSQTFIGDTGTDSVLLYACDTTDEATADMENFLIDYTKNQNPDLNYESKATYAAEFDGFRNMFLMLGGALSFIVGLVGILNFFNAILTGILTRRREFAMLQSIGMTGKQLKTMLVFEGLLYALESIVLSLLLTVLAGPLLSQVLEGMFWFYSYHLTVMPILILLPVFVLLGTVLPLLSYHGIAKQTLVERLREVE
jgi:putative ABC transport system permease protein